MRNSILNLIGCTPLIKLRRIIHPSAASVYVKLEYLNPSGSVKDRPALWMILEAERRGILKPGMEIVEVTSGNTGISLAMIAAVKGYKVTCIVAYNVSPDKIKLLEIMGVNVIKLPQNLIQSSPERAFNIAREIAMRIARERNAYYINQHENIHNVEAHYYTTAREIWSQTQGRIDVFVAGVGTGGTLFGVAKYLKERNPNIKIVAVEPKNSKLHRLIGGKNYIEQKGVSIIEGIGVRRVTKIMDLNLVDDIIVVDDYKAVETVIKLARYEGILSGLSGGANVYAAISIAEKLGLGRNVVTVIPDSIFKYINIVYEYMKRNTLK